MNIYDIRRYGKWAFFAVTALLVAIFLRVSNDLVNDLSRQERERMQIWADATKKLSSTEGFESPGDIEFLLNIIRRNNTIPVLLTDRDGNILDHRNFDLPEPIDSLQPFVLSPANKNYLQNKLDALRNGPNVIIIAITDLDTQYLYYEDSKLLKRLSVFPYLELVVMLAFIFVGYYAISSTKRAEQNKVWVGLSKETAHQLGTPISSLMAWMEYLESIGFEPETVKEMNKDVNRLSTIASRFSKIGSAPTLETADASEIVTRAADYMRRRISSRISLTVDLSPDPLPVDLSAPLVEWVMENLIKNAVDAMEGTGSITIK
ncbi:MAG: ATP-binding protein, partial [Muribaculaceae bacterium]|nr:ATP-binding protein [Muribaculaceae bacterium]